MSEKPPCQRPLDDGRRCLECWACQSGLGAPCRECGRFKSQHELAAFDGLCTECWDQVGTLWSGKPARTWRKR